ncbi:MAG: efflux RND transporter permease subunit [Prevotellaceae bacterium]|jgi:HAE1 family hydrophobic/amphiphilic exporter-1|nr:efflux RND transporter permease subunit [Prevotellaceae bacterium]
MLKIFIERPVLSTVISIIIVVLGIIGLMSLPIEQYPEIAPPTVQISANYAGASADAVMKSVVIPIEQQVNGVEGMTYITSTASNAGSASLSVYFDQETNPDMDAVNVQNLVSRASALLPAEVVQTGVIVKKSQTGNVMSIFLYSDNPDYDGKFIQNYANINIIPQIQRVQGVGQATVYGAQTYTMRIWIKPDIMTVYEIGPKEVIAALQDQNIEAAPGELGQNGNQSFQYTLKYTGRLKSIEEFENIVIRSQNAQVLKLKDIADVELGALNYNIQSSFNGKDAVMIAVAQTIGSNAEQVIADVKQELSNAAKSFPTGINYDYLIDASEFLDASISDVWHTLIIAFLLVFVVVFIFLQDIRSTIIPAIAVPVAIIGTFFFLLVFGFSINLLTLFALILAIGIVVDDAIVVVEAVHAKLDQGEKNPVTATENAMSEISSAIVSITLVMSAVFIPVSFLGGTNGVFFKQFGLTLAVAIIISAVNALTLSPALCALFLKPKNEEEKKGFFKRFYGYFNIGFDATINKYKQAIGFMGDVKRRWIPFVIIIFFSFVLVYLLRTIPSGFIPQEDSGTVVGTITLPPGSSMERTDSVINRVTEIARTMPYVKEVGSINGLNYMGGAAGLGSCYGSVMIKMEPWSKRNISTSEIVSMMTQRTDSIQEATFLFFGTPTIQGFGLSNGVTLQMEDRTGGDINIFYNTIQAFLGKLNQQQEVMLARTTFNPNFPQKQIEVDIPKIKAAGLTLNDIMTTLQAFIGSMYISNFNLYGQQYEVIVQASPEYRTKIDDLKRIYVPAGDGKMAPVTEFITITDVTGPQALMHFNLYSSMDVTVIPNIGSSTGEVMKRIEEIANETLPNGYTYEYQGLSREEQKSGGVLITIFIICLAFVYLLLSALYESYLLPFSVILSLPIGISGIFIFVFFGLLGGSGIVNNIYIQIALIMLIGLLSKNAILIVEYALQRRKQGMSIFDAALNGAVARLRPILMTSFAFIFGLLPLAFSSGAGAIGNRSIGLSAIGGMVVGTFIGVMVVPVLFMIFQTLQEKFGKTGGKTAVVPANPQD